MVLSQCILASNRHSVNLNVHSFNVSVIRNKAQALQPWWSTCAACLSWNRRPRGRGCGGAGSGSQLPPVEAGRIQKLRPFQSAPARLAHPCVHPRQAVGPAGLPCAGRRPARSGPPGHQAAQLSETPEPSRRQDDAARPEEVRRGRGLPGGADRKEPACQCRRPGVPWGGGGSPGAGMATRSSILAWRIPRTEEPGEPHSIHGVPESQTRLSAHYGEMMGVGFWKIPRSLPLSETSTVLQGGEPREASSAPGKGGSEWGWGRG